MLIGNYEVEFSQVRIAIIAIMYEWLGNHLNSSMGLYWLVQEAQMTRARLSFDGRIKKNQKIRKS